MMRSLVAKIFICSLLVQILARAALIAIAPLVTSAFPGSGRLLLTQTLPLFAELAVATLERDGQPAVDLLLARAERDTGLNLRLQPGTASCTTEPGEGPGRPIAVALERGSSGYCLVAEPLRPTRPPWPEVMLITELALSAVFSFLLARYLLQPIRRISAAAQALGRGDFSARAGLRLGRRRDEAGELVRQFDRMAEQIEKLITAQQRFIGDVSHEIKSPLARLSMALGLARREAGGLSMSRFDRMEIEIDTISQLIRELLTLSSLQAAGTLGREERLDLVALIRAVIADAAFERPDHEIHLRAEMALLPMTGDPVLLRRALENVLRNALFYGETGTPVEVSMQTLDDGCARITVTDQGPGVPDDAVERLFEPFYRVDEARGRNTGGIGIGLAICDRAIRLHGGSVAARNVRPSGLAVSMELPARAMLPRPALPAPQAVPEQVG